VELKSDSLKVSQPPFFAFVTILYEPTTTFKRINSHPTGWFPLLTVIISSCALLLWYYSVVDLPWLVDQMLDTVGSTDEREKSAEFLTREMMVVSSLGSALIGYPAILCLLAVYLVTASKAVSNGISFGKGFALVAWANIPNFLLSLLGVMQLLLASSGKIGLSELNPVSLNQLFFQFDMEHPLAVLTDSISLITFWSIFLLIIGFEVWAEVKRSTAISIVLTPYIIVYGLWFGYSMSKVL